MLASVSTTETLNADAVAPEAATPSTVPHGSIPYRTDIDGIRAVAVVLVVLYHAGVPGFSGGYIGVDVFFALSGFLITSVIMAQASSGRFSLVGFYAGRVRRLLPLSLLTLVTTVAFGVWLLPSTRAVELVNDARSALFYVANRRFADKAVAYVDTDVTDGMLTHFWSLSVEEQFYFVWPLLIGGAALIAHRSARLSLRAMVIAITSIVSAGSLLASLLLTSSGGSAAYYATHLRLWEMSLGGLLAALGASIAGRVRTLATLQVTALGLIVFAAFRFDDFTPYPGSAALLPVLATLALLAAGGAGGPVDAMLGAPPMRYLGERSFAIYLWHWPMLGISALLVERYDSSLDNTTRIILAVGAALVLAHLSHLAVENPIRFSKRLRSAAVPTLVAAAACMALLAIGGRVTQNAVVSASAAVWSEAPVDPADAAEDTATTDFRACHKGQGQDPADAEVNFCVAGDPNGTRTVVLVGDSHGQHWAPAFDEAGELNDWRVLVTTRSACLVYDVAIFSTRLEVLDDGCRDWGRAAQAAIAAEPDVDLVVVGRSYKYFPTVRADNGLSLGDAEAEVALEDAALAFVTPLIDSGASVILMEDTPWARSSVPDCLLEVTPRDAEQCDFDDRPLELELPMIRAELAAVNRTSSAADAVMSFDDLACPGGRCVAVTADGLITYRDQHHLTATYSRTLGEQLGDMLAEFVN